MKAISIRSPWWWFILHGGKDIENRDWPTSYRGDVLIHASKFFGKAEIVEDFDFARGIAMREGRTLPGPVTLGDFKAAGGCLVGRARIVGCVSSSDSPWFFGRFGFLLADVRPLATPIPWKGALGLFDVDVDLGVPAHA